MAGAKLEIELSVKDLAQGQLKALNVTLNGTAIKAEGAFKQMNMEAGRANSSISGMLGTFQKFGLAYLGLNSVKKILGMMKESSDEFAESMDGVRKAIGSILVDYFEVLGGEKATGALTSFLQRLHKEINDAKNNISNTTAPDEMANRMFDELSNILEKEKQARTESDIRYWLGEERRVRGLLKIFVDAEAEKTKALGDRITATDIFVKQQGEEKKLLIEIEKLKNPEGPKLSDTEQGKRIAGLREELRILKEKDKIEKQRLQDIAANEKRELVSNPQLGIANRSLSGNIFNIPSAILIESKQIEKYADDGRKAYDKLDAASREWYFSEVSRLEKLAELRRQNYETAAQVLSGIGELQLQISDNELSSARIAVREEEKKRDAYVETENERRERMGQREVLDKDLQTAGLAAAKQRLKQEEEDNRRSFSIWKATAIAEAGMTTTMNVLKALGNPPFPGVNIAAASFAGALGAIQIGKIMASQPPAYASGTSYARGGLSLVGERGPELVNLPRGSQVYNNSQTKNLLGGQTITINLPASSTITTEGASIISGSLKELGRTLVRANREGHLYDLKAAW